MTSSMYDDVDTIPGDFAKVKLRWTQAWRRQNKKGKVEEGGKKKARKAMNICRPSRVESHVVENLVGNI